MKLRKLLLLPLLFSAIVLGFSSCSDDDDDYYKNTPLSVVTDLTFDSSSLEQGKVGGKLTWTTPKDVADLSEFVVYMSSNGTRRDKKLASLPITATEYDIKDVDYTKYIIVVSKNTAGIEGSNVAKVEIEDTFQFGTGVFILNGGKLGSNNANLAYYGLESNTLSSNIFEYINGKKLGDVAQDIIQYGSNTYVAVYGSGVIYVLDKKGKIKTEINPTQNGQKQQPRGFTTHAGKVYVTLYDGYLAKIDTTSFEIEAKVKVGRNPEYVRVANNKLFVANSGGMDYNTALGYDKTVSVVDIATFSAESPINVIINPDKMAVDSDGDIYVISNGNYGNIPNTLQKIDSKTGVVTVLPINATWMSMNNDKLYYIYSQYDAAWNQTLTYGVYDAKNDKLLTDKFITDGTKVEKPYSITADPTTGNVYIGTSDNKTNGDMYIFNQDGKLISSFDTKGLNPIAVCPVK